MYTPYNQSLYGQAPSNMYGYQYPYNNLPTIGSIGNMGYNMGYGYNGYNGGYYTNNYNSYNPYLIRQQQEEYQKQLQEQQKNQYNINCMLHRMANNFYHEDYVEPSVQDQSEYYYYAQKKLQDVAEYEHLAYLTTHLQEVVDQQTQQKINGTVFKMTTQEQQMHKKDSLYDFLNSAGELYVKALEREANVNNKDLHNLQNLYNHDSYSKLVNMHNASSNAYNSYNKNFSIDDMEITLPEKFNTEYQQRKQAFLNSILNKMPGGGS